MDVAVAAAALVVLAPALLAIAAWIRMDSVGPALFRQRRVGLHGASFELLKFRSMTQGAARIGPLSTSPRDPRITRAGAILRGTSVDELPQLLNVLAGHMSLVGPRPDLPHQIAALSPEDRSARCSVRPGLTGLAQVENRHGGTPQERLGWDLDYAARRSIWLNARIVARTLGAMVTKRSY
ncbi:MAG: sugar transferase [Gemmatimonadota bacterium]